MFVISENFKESLFELKENITFFSFRSLNFFKATKVTNEPPKFGIKQAKKKHRNTHLAGRAIKTPRKPFAGARSCSG